MYPSEGVMRMCCVFRGRSVLSDCHPSGRAAVNRMFHPTRSMRHATAGKTFGAPEALGGGPC